MRAIETLGEKSFIRKAKRKKSGFTIVEVLAAIVIFGMVVASLFQMVGQGFSLVRSSRDINRATQTLQHQMENLRCMTWENFETQVGTSSIMVDSNGTPTGVGTGSPPFDWQAFLMTQTITLEKNKHYKVKLDLEWTDSGSRSHKRTYISWFTYNGLNEFYTRSTP